MRTVCQKGKCNGCMACTEVCARSAIRMDMGIDEYNAYVVEEKCVHCGICQTICPNNNIPIKKEPLYWFQGWSSDEKLRNLGASGGVASSIIKSFLENDGCVFCCVFENGLFQYKRIDDVNKIYSCAGSKYVKSNPKGVYKNILLELRHSRKVLFIGLPCHVAGVLNYISDVYKNNLYTIDLICHGTPDFKVLQMFLRQYKKDLSRINEIAFRIKEKYQIIVDGKNIVTKGTSDKYSIGFINASLSTVNCYSCKFAGIERISDLTLGDSWGTTLSEDERKKGISLILCQSKKGEELLKNAPVQLYDVDISNAIASNQQLKAPARVPVGRKFILNGLIKGKKFNLLILICYIKQCIKQDIKALLVKMGMCE